MITTAHQVQQRGMAQQIIKMIEMDRQIKAEKVILMTLKLEMM